MKPCPHCSADVGDASPAYCPTCRGPLLGQRRDLPPPPPGVEFDREVDQYSLEGQDAETYVAAQEIPPPPVTTPSGRGFPLKNVLRGGFLLLVLAPTAWGLIDGALNGADRTDAGIIVEAGDLEVTELRAGDCFDMPSGAEDAVEITDVDAIPCNEPHENEVYVTTNYTPSESFPGETAIWDFADQFCLTAFDTFVSIAYEDSILEFGYFYPSEEGWGDGDHTITCVLYDLNASLLTGSMRGAAR